MMPATLAAGRVRCSARLGDRLPGAKGVIRWESIQRPEPVDALVFEVLNPLTLVVPGIVTGWGFAILKDQSRLNVVDAEF